MATMTQEAERTRNLSEALSSSAINWDSLVGDVGEALKTAESSLEEMGLHEQTAQLAVVREGLIKWQKSLEKFRATEQQIRAARSRKNFVWQKLIDMQEAAEGITESLDSDDSLGLAEIQQILEELSNTVDDLINEFPEARPRPPAGYHYPSPPQQPPNNLNWINEDTLRTGSARSEARGSPPPRRNTNSSYRHANPQPRWSNTQQSSTSNYPRTVLPSQYATYVGRVTSNENSRVYAGHWYQTAADAANAPQSDSRYFEGFDLSGNSVAHLGNTYGPRSSQA